MELQETLLAYERDLSRGDGDVYRRLLTDDAVVIVPGMTLDKEQTAEAIDESPGWDTVDMTDVQLLRPNGETAVLTYRFSGRRGEQFTYEAQLSSVYVRGGDGWRLLLHQQTPVGVHG